MLICTGHANLTGRLLGMPWDIAMSYGYVYGALRDISPTKRDPKLSQMDPKWLPKGVTREPQDTKMNLARFFGDPRPFWEPFWGQWDPKGIPKSSFWD